MILILSMYMCLVPIFGQNFDTDNGCYLQVESDIARTRDVETLDVYAGNAHVYDISCIVSDSTIRSGDKYYVIDMVLYGPNSRVSKAWREQFSTSRKYRNLSLNKKLSLNSIGINRLVCSVSKYNNLVNKFSKICNKKMDINATESNLTPTIQFQSSNLDFFFLSDLQKLSLRKKINRIESKKVNLTEWENGKNDTSNLAARTMFYKGLFKSKSDIKKVIAENDELKQNEQNYSSTFSLLQPIFVIFIFLIIFSISIGTIFYLTYNHKEYASVIGDHESDLTSCQSNSQDETINNSSTIFH